MKKQGNLLSNVIRKAFTDLAVLTEPVSGIGLLHNVVVNSERFVLDSRNSTDIADTPQQEPFTVTWNPVSLVAETDPLASDAPLATMSLAPRASWPLFQEAKEKEAAAFIRYGALQKPEPGAHRRDILTTRWVLTWKPTNETAIPRRPDGLSEGDFEKLCEMQRQKSKCKARLVVRPFLRQLHAQVASPTATVESCRLLMGLSASALQFDPRGAKWDLVIGDVPNVVDAENITRAKKAVYGLPEAPLLWHRQLPAYLLSTGFRTSRRDPCVFLHPDGCVLSVHVDDLLALMTEDFRNSQWAELVEKWGIPTQDPSGRALHIAEWATPFSATGALLLPRRRTSRGYAQ